MPSQSSSPSPEKGVALDAARLHAAVDAFYDSEGNTLQGVRAAIIAWEASKPAVERAAPDMLAALIEIEPYPGWNSCDEAIERADIARAAVARATEA